MLIRSFLVQLKRINSTGRTDKFYYCPDFWSHSKSLHELALNFYCNWRKLALILARNLCSTLFVKHVL